jgi:prepilin-type N-terminal cleavage/methylation domain-containing protein
MKNKGFTLIEIMIVITVLGIIVAITIPRIVDKKNKNQLQQQPKTVIENQINKLKESSPGVYKIKLDDGKVITITITEEAVG